MQKERKSASNHRTPPTLYNNSITTHLHFFWAMVHLKSIDFWILRSKCESYLLHFWIDWGMCFCALFYAIRIFDTTHPPPTTPHTISGTDPRGKAKKSAKISKCVRDCSNQRDPLERVRRNLFFWVYVLWFPRQGKAKNLKLTLGEKQHSN